MFLLPKSLSWTGWAGCALKEVTEGMEAVDEIASVRTTYGDRPVTPVVIKKMSII